MKHISNKNKDSRGKKEWRKPYRKSEAFDSSYRCHGGCAYCLSDRTHRNDKARKEADEQLKEYRHEDTDTD